MQRIMFNDNIFPIDINRVIYRDSDQCSTDRMDLRLLNSTDLKGFPYAMVPHCTYYKRMNERIDRFHANFPQYEHYFTNNLIIIDLLKFREQGYADKIR